MRVRRGAGHGLAIVCCVVGAAGCGSSGGGSGFSGTPRQLLSDAQAALDAAHGYMLSAVLKEGGQSGQLTMSSDANRSLILSFAISGKSYSVIIVPGGTYVRANSAFWSQAGSTVASRLANRWLIVPSAEAAKLTSPLSELQPPNLQRCLGENRGTLTFAGSTTVDGRKAITIRDAGNAAGSTPGTIDIAAANPHYLLRDTGTGPTKTGGTVDFCNNGRGGDTEGALTLSEFGQVPTINAPAGAEPLSAAANG